MNNKVLRAAHGIIYNKQKNQYEVLYLNLEYIKPYLFPYHVHLRYVYSYAKSNKYIFPENVEFIDRRYSIHLTYIGGLLKFKLECSQLGLEEVPLGDKYNFTSIAKKYNDEDPTHTKIIDHYSMQQ